MRGFRDVERHFNIVEEDEKKKVVMLTAPREIGEDYSVDTMYSTRTAPREIGEDFYTVPDAPAEIG